MALIQGSIYRFFYEQNYGELWEMYQQWHNNEPDFYSTHFKDLINRMLHYDPAQRLNL